MEIEIQLVDFDFSLSKKLLSIFYMCFLFFLQEQAHKTVLETFLPVPLLIFPLHEGKTQTLVWSDSTQPEVNM